MKPHRPFPLLLCLALGVALPCFAQVPSAPSRTIAGLVRDASGKPIPGVKILVLKPEFAKPGEPPEGEAAKPDPFLRGDRSPEGAFVLEVPAGPASFHVLVQAPGYETLYLPAVNPEGEPLDIAMRPASALTGTVISKQTGAPASGARVIPARAEDRRKSAGKEETLPPPSIVAALLPEVVADTKGNWKLDGLSAGILNLRIRADGHRSFRQNDIVLRPGETRRIDATLEPAALLRGKVTGPDGKPLAKATVRLEPDLDSLFRGGIRNLRGLARGGGPEMQQVTKADGTYLFEEFPPGAKFTVEASHDDYAPAERGMTLGGPGETVTADFRLTPGARMTGVVVDENGLPVKGAIVDVEKPETPAGERDLVAGGGGGGGGVFMAFRAGARAGRRWERSAERRERREKTPEATDAEGRFDLKHLPAGEFEVAVYAAGKSRKPGVTVRLEEGKTLADQRFSIELGKPLLGRVVDEEKQPVPDARVGAFSFGEGMPDMLETFTDTDGAFELRGIQGESTRLTARAEGYAETEREEVPAGSTGIELVLKRTGAIAGRVTLDTGEVPTAISVDPSPAQEERAAGGRFALRMGQGQGERTIRAEEGMYTYEGLREGTWNVTFSAPGYLKETLEGVKVVSGQTTPEQNVTLRRGGVIAGVVVRRTDGVPVQGAEIFLKEGGFLQAIRNQFLGGGLSTASDINGAFRLEGVPPGQVTISVSHPDFASSTQEAIEVKGAGEETPVRVVLGTGGAIEGVVQKADGTPLPGESIVVSNMGMGYTNALETDSSGGYRVDLLPAGTYTVMRTPVSRRMMMGVGSRTATVKEGETVRVDFREEPGRMTGRVLRGGEPVPDASITLTKMGGAPLDAAVLQATAGPDGSYVVEDVAPGTYDARIGGDGRGFFGIGGVHLAVTMPEGETMLQHDFVLPDIWLQGRVVEDETQEPVKEGFVQASRTDAVAAAGGGRNQAGQAGSARIENDGSFRIQMPGPGAYRVVANRMGGGPGSEPVDVQVSDTGASEVILTIPRSDLVKGRVLDEAGRPVVEAMVRSGLQGPGGATMTDVAGRFLMELAEGAEVDLQVFARDKAPAVLRGVRPSPEEITIRVGPGGALDIQVNAPPDLRPKLRIELLDSAGQDLAPLLGGMAMLTGAVENDLKGSGHVLFKHLEAGGYSVVVKGGGESAIVPALVEEGKKTPVVVNMAP